MSNGLNCLLLSCALQQGGIFNFAQRFQRYYNFGYECLLGKSNWSPYVAAGTSLHEERTKQIMDTLGIGDPIGGPKDTVQADATNSDKEHAANTTDFTEAQGNAFAQVGAQGNAQGSSATSSSQQTKVGIQSELLSDLQRVVEINLRRAGELVEKLLQLDGKQDSLVSGENIKTVNGQSILGEGNLELEETDVLGKSLDGFDETGASGSIKTTTTVLGAIEILARCLENGQFRVITGNDSIIFLGIGPRSAQNFIPPAVI